MKKNLIAFLVTLFLPIVAWAGQNFGTVFDAAIYQTPDRNGKLITTIEVGSELTVTAFDHDNYWARVILPDGQTGYVDSGSLDYPGGQTVTVTETFDANNIAAKQQNMDRMWKLLSTIVFLLLMAAGLVHMLHIRNNVDNEPRIFVGSISRIVLLAVLLSSGLLLGGGVIWAKLLYGSCIILLVAFSYYAYLRPQSKLLVEGPPSRNALQVLGGFWSNLENKKVDQERMDFLNNRIHELKQRSKDAPTENYEKQLESEIDSLKHDKTEEKTNADQTVSLLFLSIAVGILFVWITPFVAILQYVRNYPLYLRKRDKYQQKAAQIGYID